MPFRLPDLRLESIILKLIIQGGGQAAFLFVVNKTPLRSRTNLQFLFLSIGDVPLVSGTFLGFTVP